LQKKLKERREFGDKQEIGAVFSPLIAKRGTDPADSGLGRKETQEPTAGGEWPVEKRRRLWLSKKKVERLEILCCGKT